MKTLSRFLVVLALIAGFFGFFGQLPAQALGLPASSIVVADTLINKVDAKLSTEYGQKIDLNNSDIRDFRELRGFYPNLAGKIIKNAPYDNVDDVLNIPGLSDGQKDKLQANLDKFTVTEPAQELIEGDDRFNIGVY